MNEKRKSQLILRLKRLVLAYHSFNQAIALGDHLRDTGITPRHAIYTPCVAGIAVTYMKPFVESEGLGPLPSEFESFTDPLYQHTHKLLKESRHKVYAHRDMSAAAELKYDNSSTVLPYEFAIQLERDQPPTYYLSIPDLNPDIGSAIRELCVFQSQRAGTMMNEIITELAEGRPYKSGRYMLGKTFP